MKNINIIEIHKIFYKKMSQLNNQMIRNKSFNKLAEVLNAIIDDFNENNMMSLLDEFISILNNLLDNKITINDLNNYCDETIKYFGGNNELYEYYICAYTVNELLKNKKNTEDIEDFIFEIFREEKMKSLFEKADEDYVKYLLSKKVDDLTKEEINYIKNNSKLSSNLAEIRKNLLKKIKDLLEKNDFDINNENINSIINYLELSVETFPSNNTQEDFMVKAKRIIDDMKQCVGNDIKKQENRIKIMMNVARTCNLFAKKQTSSDKEENPYYSMKNRIIKQIIDEKNSGKLNWPMGYISSNSPNEHSTFCVLMPKEKENDDCVLSSLHYPALDYKSNAEKLIEKFPINVDKEGKFLKVRVNEITNYVLSRGDYVIKGETEAEINSEIKKRIEFFGGKDNLKKNFLNGNCLFQVEEIAGNVLECILRYKGINISKQTSKPIDKE